MKTNPKSLMHIRKYLDVGWRISGNYFWCLLLGTSILHFVPVLFLLIYFFLSFFPVHEASIKEQLVLVLQSWTNVRSDFMSTNAPTIVAEICICEGCDGSPPPLILGVGRITNSPSAHCNSGFGRKEHWSVRLPIGPAQVRLAGSPQPFCSSQQSAAQGNCLFCSYLELAVKIDCH